MIGRRATVGLSLLCALMFCAFAAQSASAAKGTTAFTCVKVEKGAEFEDAHCDVTKVGGAGYIHEEIEVGKETKITGSNEKTLNKTTEHVVPVFKSTRAGVEVVISCTETHSTGTLKNTTEGVPAKMHAGGSGIVHYSGCKVTKPVKAEKERCTVKTVGNEVGKVTTRTLISKTKIINEEAGKEEMGVEFIPEEEENEKKEKIPGKFVILEFGNAPGQTCPFAGAVPVEGSVIGTPGNSPNGKGATLWFNIEKGMQKLTFGGAEATYTGVETLEMEEAKPTTGNAISLTTTTEKP